MESRVFSSLRVLALGAGFCFPAALCHAQTAAPASSRVHSTPIVIKNVPADLMAWWLDPKNNPTPQIIKNQPRFQPNESINPRAENSKSVFDWPAGIERIVAIDQQNVIIVTGTSNGVQELQKTIDFLDQPMRQVELEAQFVQVSTSDSRAFEIDFTDRNGISVANFNPATTDIKPVFQMGFIRKNFQNPLTALINTNRAKVIAVPRVIAINNIAVSIFATSRIHPFPLVTQGVTQEMKTYLEATKNDPALIVTPTINNDNTITVLLSIAPAKLKGEQQIQDSAPGISVFPQGLNCIANVKDGETIALSGLKAYLPPAPEPKTPSLFKNSIKDTQELLIFLTARIVHRAGSDETPIPGAD